MHIKWAERVTLIKSFWRGIAFMNIYRDMAYEKILKWRLNWLYVQPLWSLGAREKSV